MTNQDQWICEDLGNGACELVRVVKLEVR